MDKDWVTRHSGTIGHSVARHSVDLALGPLGTASYGHWDARHSVALSIFQLIERERGMSLQNESCEIEVILG